MRAPLAIAVAIGLFAASPAVEAKAKKKSVATAKTKRAKKHDPKARVSVATTTKRAKKHDTKAKKKRTAIRTRQRPVFLEPKGPIHGQSVGAPWAGRLREATALPEWDGYVLRRPWRAFGTKSMVETLFHAVGRVREQFPEIHAIAIGDLSAPNGGRISDHSSHQSGRDVDLGLIYNEVPRGFPESFIAATQDNLDCQATLALVEELAATQRVQMMFLDYKVQGMLVDWARANGVDEDKIERLFQFPHGRGASIGLVRHEPNHMDHLHVRFKCPAGDNACR